VLRPAPSGVELTVPLVTVVDEPRFAWRGVMLDVARHFLPLGDLLFPRTCGLSEVAWSAPTGRSWSEFEPRLEGHLGRLDALGVGYRPEAGPRPWQQGGTGALGRLPEQASPGQP